MSTSPRDPLTVMVKNRMLEGVYTRKYDGVGEPVGQEVEQESRSTGRTVSELYRADPDRTEARWAAGWTSAPSGDDARRARDRDRTHVVYSGSNDGVKNPLGLWEGSTENVTLRARCWRIWDRGLDPEQAILLVIDGGKA